MLRKPDISTELVMGLLAFTSSTNSFFHTITLAEKGTPYILSQTFHTVWTLMSISYAAK
jgi:hypothetical protein